MNNELHEQTFKLRSAHPESLAWLFGGFILLVIAIVGGIDSNFLAYAWFTLGSLGLIGCLYGLRLMFNGRLILNKEGLRYGGTFIPWEGIEDSHSLSKSIGSIRRMTLTAISLKLKDPDKVFGKLPMLSKLQQNAWFGSQISGSMQQTDLHQPQEFFIVLTHSSIEPDELNEIIRSFLKSKLRYNNPADSTSGQEPRRESP